MSLTIGSLFSGIGGLELGLERAGLGPVVFQVEKDEYCRAVLAKHWPDATRYEDVKDVGRANLVPVDVICGGFPCQDVSNAGRRSGVVAGTRSGLWFEYSRIIRELRPRYVVVENVAALLTLGLDAVLGELAESGYDAEWDCVPAVSVGAPHRRDRVFVVAYAHGEHGRVEQQQRRGEGSGTWDESGRRRASDALADAAGDRWPIRGARHEGHDADAAGRIGVRAESRGSGASHGTPHGVVPNPMRSGSQGHGNLAGRDGAAHAAARNARWWAVEPDVGRVAHGIPRRVDRLRALGNAVVPAVAEVVGRVILALEAQREVA